MEIDCESLDTALYRLFKAIKKKGARNGATRGGTWELRAVSLRIRKPRARLSRSENRGRPFSAIGELLWYLSGLGTLEFIKPYVPAYSAEADGDMIYGAYGPRLRNMRGSVDQFDSVVRLLAARPGSRRAVIQLFNAEDIADDHGEIPCTTTLQFLVRDGLLHMAVTMRSNDAYLGLPHDVFCFTMIQEMMARRLEVELGEYYQFVGSMHIYDRDLEGIDRYLDEGFQQTAEMPAMPYGNPFNLVDPLLAIEERLRRGEHVDAAAETTDPYWADIVRLLQVFWAREWADDHPGRLAQLRGELDKGFYRPYIDGRMHLMGRANVKAASAMDKG